MTEQDKRASFNRVKAELVAFIKMIQEQSPEAAKYLEEHMVIDEKSMTFMYTGDDRIKMTRVR
jgi:hypothetical protein